jgi:hypothetical protein
MLCRPALKAWNPGGTEGDDALCLAKVAEVDALVLQRDKEIFELQVRVAVPGLAENVDMLDALSQETQEGGSAPLIQSRRAYSLPFREVYLQAHIEVGRNALEYEYV